MDKRFPPGSIIRYRSDSRNLDRYGIVVADEERNPKYVNHEGAVWAYFDYSLDEAKKKRKAKGNITHVVPMGTEVQWLGTITEGIVAGLLCANCNEPIKRLDYLCGRCRGNG